MEKRFDVSYLICNGKGCAAMKTETFIGKRFADVLTFIKEKKTEYANCSVDFSIYEGWGMNQKKVKNFVQKLTYDDGRVKEIHRDCNEVLDFYSRLENNEIDSVRNPLIKSIFEFSFDRGNIHYDFYVGELE